MSTNPSARGPGRGRVPSWSELSTVQRTGVIAAFALLVLCCGAVLIPMSDDADPDPPDEGATGIETTASASPSEPDPTTTRPEPTETTTSASPEPEPEPESEPTEAEEDEVYYDNCDAARDAGAAPVHEGEAGYRSGLDRDGDGVGCEDSSSSGSGGGGGSGGGDDGGADVYYDNCTEAREAGAAPLYAGDPGYGSHLDRDGDGAACE
ncbi:excalibur calcium-binding domain-containing protein [Glycomyces tenuis]|uniref:excalibur calcium-binding domain-containing protein n=1 Tax=Glycomyces tenuis TaxID=58116 RepID=UPI002481521F|nr:excalibur calcium-binding domain-containing protein [Glycomyces tenuis]